MTDVILETRNLTKEFKGFTAVNDVNLKVERGHIHALIGPNGAGKTTCFNLLTKFLAPTSGTILFDGKDITAEPPSRIARRGMVRSFQISAVFPHLTVLENVRLGLQRPTGLSYRFWTSVRALQGLEQRARALLAEVGLEEVADELTVNLPYGRKRALASRGLSDFSLFQKWYEVPRRRCRPNRTFSRSVRCGNTADIWNERMMPRRAICAGRSPVMSCPLNRIVPVVGSRNFVSRLKQVVLPAPLGPIRAWIEPRLTERSTFRTARKPANSMVSPRASRTISPLSIRAAATSPQSWPRPITGSAAAVKPGPARQR